MRPIIQSQKHYVQVSLATVTAGTNTVTGIVQGVELGNVSAGNTIEVQSGATVKAIYIEMWVKAGDTAGGSSLLTLFKVSSNGTMTFAEQVSLHTYDNKKNVLYHTQGITPRQEANPVAFMRGWFKIPKGKQRIGLGDKISLAIAAQALDNIICGFMTYKSYT